MIHLTWYISHTLDRNDFDDVMEYEWAPSLLLARSDVFMIMIPTDVCYKSPKI